MTDLTIRLPSMTVGGLDSYVRAVRRIPLLTPEEEIRLATQLHQNNDIEAAHRLVLSHLRTVVSIARSYAGYGLQQGDLIQEGNLGLMKAVRRFDPTRGVRLFSFAVHWIRAEIHEFILRNWRLVRVATTKAQRKLFFNLRRLKPSFSSLTPLEAQEIANTLDVKPEEVFHMEMRLSGQEIALEPNPNDPDDVAAPLATLADWRGEPTERMQQAELERLEGAGLCTALDTLDARSRRIIEARWLAEAGTKTLHELAEEFSVSAERIRQIEQKALQKMRHHLLPYIH